MIKEALEYIIGMKKPNIEFIDGSTYSDKELRRISYNPKADTIEMHTLSSLVDYIKANIDEVAEKMIIHVKGPTHVRYYSMLDTERKRELMVEVHAQVPSFKFNQFIGNEEFCINLQSKFIDSANTDKALLLQFAGTVESGTIAEYSDDGVTQKATIKTGLASKNEAVVPSPASLIPYRTFIEVEQPMSQFIFRMKDDKYNGVQCALFEADGGAWEIDAMDEIKAYLEENLKGIEGITIIS